MLLLWLLLLLLLLPLLWLAASGPRGCCWGTGTLLPSAALLPTTQPCSVQHLPQRHQESTVDHVLGLSLKKRARRKHASTSSCTVPRTVSVLSFST